MDSLPPFLICLAAAYGFAFVVAILTSARGRPVRALVWAAPFASLCVPLLIPDDFVKTRAAAFILCVDLMFRLVDCARRSAGDASGLGRLRERFVFLIPLPIFVGLLDQKERQRATGTAGPADWAAIAVGVGVCWLCWEVVEWGATNTELQSSFALDHCLKLGLFVIAVEAGARALCGLERILGFRTEPLVRSVWRSRTPGEFWRRWNNRVHAWLYRHVFVPCGGKKHPGRAVWLTFLFSGLFHELCFGIATSRFDGYQLAFFVIQAPAVLLTGKLGRWTRRGGVAGRIGARAFTILYLGATSILFLHGVDRIFPQFYTGASLLP